MIHICVRTDVAWADEAAFFAQLSPAFAPKVEQWDRTFTMPYHRFRHALRALAAENHAAVRGAAVTRWEDVPVGALVVPVDDDDWFAPDLVGRLQAADDGKVAGLRWQPATVEVAINAGHRLYIWRQRLVPFWPPAWLCMTNNYAVRKGVMGEAEFRSHVRASARFTDATDVLVLGHRLSLHNRSIASITSMGWQRPGISARRLLSRRRAYLSLYAGYRPPHDDLAWAVPYVRQMHDLMLRLEPR